MYDRRWVLFRRVGVEDCEAVCRWPDAVVDLGGFHHDQSVLVDNAVSALDAPDFVEPLNSRFVRTPNSEKSPSAPPPEVWRLAGRIWKAENSAKVDQTKNGRKLRRITFLSSAVQDVRFG